MYINNSDNFWLHQKIPLEEFNIFSPSNEFPLKLIVVKIILSIV